MIQMDLEVWRFWWEFLWNLLWSSCDFSISLGIYKVVKGYFYVIFQLVRSNEILDKTRMSCPLLTSKNAWCYGKAWNGNEQIWKLTSDRHGVRPFRGEDLERDVTYLASPECPPSACDQAEDVSTASLGLFDAILVAWHLDLILIFIDCRSCNRNTRIWCWYLSFKPRRWVSHWKFGSCVIVKRLEWDFTQLLDFRVAIAWNCLEYWHHRDTAGSGELCLPVFAS